MIWGMICTQVTQAEKVVWRAKVERVIDGDSLQVRHQGVQKEIRLIGVDTPEYTQPWGKAATYFVMNVCLDQEVTLEVYGQDKYQRYLVKLYVQENELNHLLVEQGYAWVFPKLTAESRPLKKYEQEAKRQKIGLWQQDNPVAPWVFRRQKKKRKTYHYKNRKPHSLQSASSLQN